MSEPVDLAEALAAEVARREAAELRVAANAVELDGLRERLGAALGALTVHEREQGQWGTAGAAPERVVRSRGLLRRLLRVPSAAEVGLAFSASAAAMLAGWIVRFESSESDVAMIFVAALAIVNFQVRFIAGVVAAVCAVLGFAFYFVQPRYSLQFNEPRYWLTLLVMFGVGVVVAFMTTRLQDRTDEALLREARNALLLQLTRELATSESWPQAFEVAQRHWPSLLAPIGRRRGEVIDLPLVAVLGERVPWERAAGAESHQRVVLETAVTLVREVQERMRSVQEAEEARVRVENERLRSTFLASVSHDLRTPLAGITGAATTLLTVGERLDASTRKELGGRIVSEASRLQRLVGNVLALTRLDDPQLVPDLDWDVPEEIVRATARATGRRLGIRVVLQFPDHPFLACFDAVLIEQVLANLIENAVVHAGVDAPIEVGLDRSSDAMLLWVGDRGPGFGALDPAQLFGKFVRGGGAAKGSGLGLAICKAVARLHGGEIWAVAREGGGAMFYVKLPLGGPFGAPPPDFDEVLDSATRDL